MGSDANSLKVNPFFVSNTNLMVSQRQLNGAGIYVPGCNVDIDNEVRNASAPDIGAQEFTVDFGILDLLQPTLNCFHTNSEAVEFRVVQYGDAAFIDLQIAYQVNGGAITTETITGTTFSDIDYTFTTTEDLSAIGNYVFKAWLVNTSDENINNDTLTKTIYRDNVPTASFTYLSACANEQTSFTGSGSVSTGTIDSYEWLFADGDTSTLQNPLHLYDTSGTYSVELRAYSNVGCYGNITQNVVVEITPNASFSISNNCAQDTTIFTNNTTISSGTATYEWDFGNGGNTTLQNPSYNYLNPGNYNVRLVATTNGSTCKDTSIQNIDIYPTYFDTTAISGSPSVTYNGTIYTSPAQVVENFTTINGCDSIIVTNIFISAIIADFVVDTNSTCVGSSISFTDSSAGNAISWNWDFGDGTTSNLQNPTHTYTASGTYDVSLTATASGGSDSETKTGFITVNASPTVNAGLDQSICEGSSITLSASTTDSLAWDNNVVNGVSFVPASTTTYIATAINSIGCIMSDTVVIIVNQKDLITIDSTVCNAIQWGGTSLTSSGTYYDSLINTAGCDSIITLNLTFNQSSNTTDSLTQCDSLTWLNGITYFASNNTATYTYKAQMVVIV